MRLSGSAIRSCALRKAKLGPDHPETLRSMAGVATARASLGHYGDAIALFEQTLALQRAKLGDDHPDTFRAMHDLAATIALGRHGEALKLNEQTLAPRKAKLGLAHVDTLESQMRVASGLLQLGRAAEAIAPVREAAKAWEKGTSDRRRRPLQCGPLPRSGRRGDPRHRQVGRGGQSGRYGGGSGRGPAQASSLRRMEQCGLRRGRPRPRRPSRPG